MTRDEMAAMLNKALQDHLENPPPESRWRQDAAGLLWFLPGSHKDRTWRRMDSYENWTRVGTEEPDGYEIDIDTAGRIMARACNGGGYPRPVASELEQPPSPNI